MPASQDSRSEGAEEQEEQWDDWESDEGQGFRSLWERDVVLPSLDEVLAHDERAHGFNLRRFRAQVCWGRGSGGGGCWD